MPKRRPLPELIRERSEVAARGQELDAEILSRLEELRGVLAGVSGEMEQPRADSPPGSVVLRTDQRGRLLMPLAKDTHTMYMNSLQRLVQRQISKSSKYDEAIAAILTEVKRPMKTKELFSRLIESGVQVDGKVPTNNLSAHLSHSDKFVNTPDGWALKQGQIG